MASLFSTTFRIRAANGANGFLYFIGRLPLVGKLLPDRVYAIGGLKTAITLIITIVRELAGFVTKALYLFLAILLAAELLTTGDIVVGWSGLLPAFVHILFFLSCVIPLFSDSKVLKATKDKFICIKYMHASPRRYMLATVPFEMATFFVTFLPALILCTVLAGGSVAEAFGLLLMLAAFRFLGEAFQLWWYKRFGFSLFRKAAVVWVLILAAGVAAYLPVLLGLPLYAAQIFLSLPGVLVMAALLLFGLWYVFWGYGYWQRAITRNLKAEYVVPNQGGAAQAAFRDVQMKEEDLAATPRQSAGIERKKGYAYFNALFFSRHRRQLFRPVVIRLGIVGALLVGVVAALLIAPGEVAPVVRRIPEFLPVFVFIMYFTSMGAKACKAMFYNCDNSMLRYAFYRRPRVILQNFRIRLQYVAGYNLLVGGAICVAVIVAVAVAGGAVATLAMAAFCASVLLLSIFFSVHHMFLYYVFQPYTSELNVKNPFFNIINVAVYAACFACLQISTGGLPFALGVLGVTLLYNVAALLLVYRFSPKRFRVK